MMLEPLRILLLVAVFFRLLQGVVTYYGLWGLLMCCPPLIFSAMEIKILCPRRCNKENGILHLWLATKNEALSDGEGFCLIEGIFCLFFFLLASVQ